MKKIIPCLDMFNGKVVKGINFDNVEAVGDAVENALAYEKAGADELVMLDISATIEHRETNLEIVKRVLKVIRIPLAVGGGIKSVDEAKRLLDTGVSKVGINSAAYRDETLIPMLAKLYGSDKVISAVDAKWVDGSYHMFIDGGKKDTGLDAIEWCAKTEAMGAGEILLTSIDADGEKTGYDLKLTKAVADRVKIPVTASGGAGCKEDFLKAFEAGAEAALAASLFHYREIEIFELKKYLRENGVEI